MFRKFGLPSAIVAVGMLGLSGSAHAISCIGGNCDTGLNICQIMCSTYTETKTTLPTVKYSHPAWTSLGFQDADDCGDAKNPVTVSTGISYTYTETITVGVTGSMTQTDGATMGANVEGLAKAEAKCDISATIGANFSGSNTQTFTKTYSCSTTASPCSWSHDDLYGYVASGGASQTEQLDWSIGYHTSWNCFDFSTPLTKTGTCNVTTAVSDATGAPYGFKVVQKSVTCPSNELAAGCSKG